MTRTFNCAGGVICVTMLLLAGLVLAASSSGGAWPVSTSACCTPAEARAQVLAYLRDDGCGPLGATP